MAKQYCLILAIDHRANLLDALNKHASTPLTDAEFVAFKSQVIGSLSDQVSAVLTDPDYGIGAGILSQQIRPAQGLLAPLEVTNYDVHPSQREVEFISGWSVRQVKRMGGDGVKLLLYYHPDAPNAEKQRGIVRRIVDECSEEDIPFFLEPIPYSLDSSKTLPNADLRQITVSMTKEFGSMGVDVLKLQFPVDAAQSRDEAEWRSACEAVNAASVTSWTLLSGGVDFETFALQTQIACESGASGVIVGRAVWNEAVSLSADERKEFLMTTGRDRVQRLAAICETADAKWNIPTDDIVTTPGWYQKGADQPSGA